MWLWRLLGYSFVGVLCTRTRCLRPEEFDCRKQIVSRARPIAFSHRPKLKLKRVPKYNVTLLLEYNASDKYVYRTLPLYFFAAFRASSNRRTISWQLLVLQICFEPFLISSENSVKPAARSTASTI
jgi:hypothetical protein